MTGTTTFTTLAARDKLTSSDLFQLLLRICQPETGAYTRSHARGCRPLQRVLFVTRFEYPLAQQVLFEALSKLPRAFEGVHGDKSSGVGN